MHTPSLQDVMNDVTRALEAYQPQDDDAHHPQGPRDALDELSIFASLDPLLGDLQRQYKEARYMRRKQEQEFGRDDAMADVARDYEDSTWCSMQTRYMEVRGDRDMMREVQAIQNEVREEELKVKEGEKRRQSLETFYQMDMMERMRNEAKTPAIFEWIMLLWMMKVREQRFSMVSSFSQLAA